MGFSLHCSPAVRLNVLALDLIAAVCFAKNTAVEAGEGVAHQAVQLFGGFGTARLDVSSRDRMCVLVSV